MNRKSVMNRTSKASSIVGKIDLTIPVKSDEIMAKVSPDDCFGKLWDLRTTECSRCADRDICGIVFNDITVKKKIKEVQDEQGSTFLDLTDFKNVNEKGIRDFVTSGETTTKDLIAYVMGVAITSDRKAALEFLKRYITENNFIYTKGGIVWIR